MPTLTIDGRVVTVAEGTTLLTAARGAGVDIPTLCHHDALEPWGACRLCLVDVTRTEWDGWCKMVVSCMATADDGLIVDTTSERVMATRKVAVDLLLARCPGTPVIQKLAAEYGVTETSYAPDAEATDCILCGLCTRVCEAYATSAITTWGRGTERAIGTFAHQPPEDCVGCGGCALVCPTGHIKDTRTATGYDIWQRTFETAVCVVDEATCLGCGSCEEACPFSVARVAMRADGVSAATIPSQHCRGCGACVGACPTGAVIQLGESLKLPSPGEITVVACGRSNLTAERLPSGVNLVDVPCAGTVAGPWLLASVAAGGRGTLVLGRHQETCRLNGAEDPASELCGRLDEALALVGNDAPVWFAAPRPGRTGARAMVAELLAEVPAGAERAVPPELLRTGGVQGSLELLRWMREGRPLHGDGWLALRQLPKASPGGPALYVGDLPLLDLVLGPMWRPFSAAALVRPALALLGRFDIEAGVALDASGTYATFGGLTDFVAGRGVELPRPVAPTSIACAAELAVVVEALGHEPVEIEDPLPQTFALTAADRARAVAALSAAEQKGAHALLVRDAEALARWALVTRPGAWSTSRVRPILVAELAALAAAPVTFVGRNRLLEAAS